MEYAHFLQSDEWEAFQRAVGRKTWRTRGRLLICHETRGGFHYLYSPFPRCGDDTSSFLSEAKKIAKKEKSVFLKLDAPIECGEYLRGTKESTSLQPRKTVVTDISRTQEEILSAMHEKTRYNIRLAERLGVQVVKTLRGNKEEDFETFWKLLSETAKRDGFSTHLKEYYKKLVYIESSTAFSNELFFARVGDVVLAVVMINFYEKSRTVTYLHGASTRERKEVMAPYLLHWRVMQEARARGFTKYDWWGIDEKKWPGLTRFKTGFGGEIKEHNATRDISYRPMWYALYRFMRKFR